MTWYFTSITANYFAKARTLGETLKYYNSNAKFVVVLSDYLPEAINLEKEPIDYVLYSREFKCIGNVNAFFFKHTITELCTAVKAMAALEIIERFKADNVIYLDPDIAVFNSLSKLEQYFLDNSILLTPHQTKPEQYDQFVVNNEILFLKRGTFNFGFFGVKNDSEGLRFLNWWNSRLFDYCFDDNYDLLPELSQSRLLGLFTDQKWGDLVPALFDHVKIIKDPGYNVCTWNLTQRVLQVDGNKITVDGEPLYFFHFSGYDSGGHINELNNILAYDKRNIDVRKISKWYGDKLTENGEKIFSAIKFDLTCYSNGEVIRDFERKLYHIRKDIHDLEPFKDPFKVTDGMCFYKWVREEYKYWYQYFDTYKNQTELNHSAFIKLLPLKSRRRQVVKSIYNRLRRRSVR